MGRGCREPRQLSRWASPCPPRSGEVTDPAPVLALVQEGAVSPKGTVTAGVGHGPGKPVGSRTWFSSLSVSADSLSFWLVCRESFSGCLHNGIEMSSPVSCRLVVTAREVALLIYYSVCNLGGVSACEQELCVKRLTEGV